VLAEALASDALALVRRCRRLKVVTLADGADDVQRLLEKHVDEATFGCTIYRLIDFWHVIEKLGEALALIERDDAARKARLAEWRRQLCQRRTAPQSILDELRASGKEHTAGKECPVHAAITYFENQGHLMGFVEARKLGLPIGSGNVEATGKSLFAIRMKRPGARWKSDTAASTRITNGGSRNIYPQVDGTRAVWQQSPVGGSVDNTFALVASPLASVSPSQVADKATQFQLRNGVLAWVETPSTTSRALKTSVGGMTRTLSSLSTVNLLANGSGWVVYSEAGKVYSWNATSGLSKLRLDVAPGQAYVSGGAMVFTLGVSVYRVGLD
jgi:hypothetical protein